MPEDNSHQIDAIQAEISTLTNKLAQARHAVKTWTDASVNLSRSAAKARAENQNFGRGLGGALLGSKFRSSARSAAAKSNARIAQEVAEKRAKIAKGKREAQEVVQNIQARLTALKEQQRYLLSQNKIQGKTKTTAAKNGSRIN